MRLPVKLQFASFAQGNLFPHCFFVVDMLNADRGPRIVLSDVLSHAIACISVARRTSRARPLSTAFQLPQQPPAARPTPPRTVALVPYHTRCSRRFRRSRLATPLDARTCAHVMHHTHTHTCSSTPLSSATGRCKRSSSPRPDVRPRSTPAKPASRPPAQGERAHACAVMTIAILAVVAQ